MYLFPQAKAGKAVDVEELPPVISIGHQEGKPRPQPQPQAVQGGDDEFELSEEDLAAWAGNLVDDREGGFGWGGCGWVGMWVWVVQSQD